MDVMMDRRIFSLLLLGGSALAGCASVGDDGTIATADDQPEMLFISPMGEPFRAKPPAPYPVVNWFKQADTNADGKLDLDEFLADASRFFHVLDLNQDGVIDHREIFYYENRVCPEIIGHAYGRLYRPGGAKLWLAQFGGGGPGGAGGLTGPPVSEAPESSLVPPHGSSPSLGAPTEGAAAYGLLADPEPVQGADIRLSGRISLSDFRTRAEQRFKILDYDDKGYLTLAGLPETSAQKLLPQSKGGRGRRRA
jgi:hypothetical protein